eukprot:Phypoly_transcript_22645.p1 GENE.Phypoly_transcript_22645~~Phypoly_transcript_22645.p1  ORF type:complete len:149 (-),score=16.01 Phypoly_transcript_22645:102-548(-)
MSSSALSLLLCALLVLSANGQLYNYNTTYGFYITTGGSHYSSNAIAVSACYPVYSYFAGSVGLQCKSPDVVYIYVDAVDYFLNFSLTNSPQKANFTCFTTDQKYTDIVVSYDIAAQLASGIGGSSPNAQFLGAATMICDIIYAAMHPN